MKEILGKTYMSDKEAAYRYGLSQSWFKKRRREKKSPQYLKHRDVGKILYELEQTDKWFAENLMEINKGA